jgi:hypothetical protein
MQFLQNYPHFLEVVYDGFEKLLKPFKRWLKPGSRIERSLIWVEEVGKGAVFNCQMCGQCILHSTGMTCSMNCPKNLRNGPCGGVRINGHCEVKPEMKCVWVEAFERSKHMPTYGHELMTIQPPVNRQLEGSSSWINMLYDIDTQNPKGWIDVNDIPIKSPEQTKKEKALWTQISNQAVV